jgi:hypothetical protein
MLLKEEYVAGGTKPTRGTKRAEKFQNGAKKAGGIGARRHAGPGRASKPRPVGSKAAKTEKETI